MGDELTAEQHARLAAELAELEGPKRREIVEAISVARGHGDLSENFEYHAAKNEQGLLERRITILRDRLDHAQIVEDGDRRTSSPIGSHVVVEDESGERIDVELSALGGVGHRLAVVAARLGHPRQASRRFGRRRRRRAARGARRSSRFGRRRRTGLDVGG